jgi:hypothetical protein
MYLSVSVLSLTISRAAYYYPPPSSTLAPFPFPAIAPVIRKA